MNPLKLLQIQANRNKQNKAMLPAPIVVQEAGALRDPKKTTIKSVAQPITSGSGTGFEESPVDLEQVSRAYLSDSYIRRAVDRHVAGMFKSGWELKSKNDAASEYVWMRLKLMAEATKIPTDDLWRQMGYDYVLFGNAFVIKARAKKAVQVPGLNAIGYTNKQPIAGYFPASATTFQIERDENGNVTKYQQSSGGGSGVEYAETEVVHLPYKRPTGRAYGVPMIHNVLQDVLLLRQIEDNVYRLIYKHLFPKQVLTVGLPEAGFEATAEEIEEVRDEIRLMSADAVLVFPERYKLESIGGDSTALDVSNYLKYFRQRIFTGLNVSDSVMGIGDTANKSTSDNMSSDLNDSVKDFQENFAIHVQQKIINELLFEGGFDPTLNPDDEVIFSFTEIEQSAKIARENHAIQLFTQNAITFEEMRMEMNRDVTVDEGRLFFQMITASQAQQAADLATQAAMNQTSNQNQPENQNGKQEAPNTKKRENSGKKAGIQESEEKDGESILTNPDELVSFTSELGIDQLEKTLTKHWSAFKQDMEQEAITSKQIELASRLLTQSLMKTCEDYSVQALKAGWGKSQKQEVHTSQVAEGTAYILKEMNASVTRLFKSLESRLQSSETKESRERIFLSHQYRLRLISKMELYRAYNIGLCLAARESGLQNVGIVTNETACEECKNKTSVDVTASDWIQTVPPHHPGCTCTMDLGGLE